MNLFSALFQIGSYDASTPPNFAQVTTEAFKAALVQLYGSSSSPLYIGSPHPPVIGLYSNVYTPNVQTVLADLTECVFTGYSRQAVTAWGTPVVDSDGSWQSWATNLASFVASSATPTDQIAGVFLFDQSLAVFAAAPLPSPIPINLIGDGVVIALGLQVGP
jgi:hypothetical protein